MTTREEILALVPKTCPTCGHALVLSDDMMHLRCPNTNCGGSLYRRLEIMAKAFGIENIGIKTARNMVLTLGLASEEELFQQTPQTLLNMPGYKIGMATKVYESIKAKTKIPYANFIRGCQFERVGQGTAEDLAKLYPNIEDLLSTTKEEIKKKYNKAAEGLAEIIYNSIQQKTPLVKKLLNYVSIEYPVAANPVGQMDILAVVTGSLNYGSRPAFQKFLKEKYGIRFTSSVSKNVDYLITNDINPAKPSSKFKTATEIQQAGGKTKIVTEQQFLELVGEKSAVDALLKNQAEQAANNDMFANQAFEL